MARRAHFLDSQFISGYSRKYHSEAFHPFEIAKLALLKEEGDKIFKKSR